MSRAPAVGFSLFTPPVVALAFDEDPEVVIGLYPLELEKVMGDVKAKKVLMVTDLAVLKEASRIRGISSVAAFAAYTDLQSAGVPIVDGDKRTDGIVTSRRLTVDLMKQVVMEPPKPEAKDLGEALITWATFEGAIKDVTSIMPGEDKDDRKARSRIRRTLTGFAVGIRRTSEMDKAIEKLQEYDLGPVKAASIQGLLKDSKLVRRLWKAYYAICVKGYEADSAAEKYKTALTDLEYVLKLVGETESDDFIHTPE